MGNYKKNGGILLLMMMVVVVDGELQRFEAPTKTQASISALVIGDWGRKGDYNQSLLASQDDPLQEVLILARNDKGYEFKFGYVCHSCNSAQNN